MNFLKKTICYGSWLLRICVVPGSWAVTSSGATKGKALPSCSYFFFFLFLCLFPPLGTSSGATKWTALPSWYFFLFSFPLSFVFPWALSGHIMRRKQQGKLVLWVWTTRFKWNRALFFLEFLEGGRWRYIYSLSLASTIEQYKI